MCALSSWCSTARVHVRPHSLPCGYAAPVNNGGQTDRYYWTQTLQDLTIFFPVPDGTRGKFVDYKLTLSQVRVGLKGQAPMLDGKLLKRVKPEDSYWTLGTCGHHPRRALGVV